MLVKELIAILKTYDANATAMVYNDGGVAGSELHEIFSLTTMEGDEKTVILDISEYQAIEQEIETLEQKGTSAV